jgi:hypothetical protein
MDCGIIPSTITPYTPINDKNEEGCDCFSSFYLYNESIQTEMISIIIGEDGGSESNGNYSNNDSNNVSNNNSNNDSNDNNNKRIANIQKSKLILYIVDAIGLNSGSNPNLLGLKTLDPRGVIVTRSTSDGDIAVNYSDIYNHDGKVEGLELGDELYSIHNPNIKLA